MIKFKYRYCKAHMARYLSGDLSDSARRRIARYIDECEDCYQEYIRQRTLVNKLERNLPVLGRPSTQKLENIWSSIQSEMALAGATPSSGTATFRSNGSHNTWSLGLVMLMLVLMLLIPLVVGYQASVASVPLPPLPQVTENIKTPTTVAENHVVLASITQPGVPLNIPLLQNTPAPNVRH